MIDIIRFSDLYNAPGKDRPIFKVKVDARVYVEGKAKEGKITWTTISVGPFFDWGLVNQFIGFGTLTLCIWCDTELTLRRPEEQNGYPLRRGKSSLPYHDNRLDLPIRGQRLEQSRDNREQAHPRS